MGGGWRRVKLARDDEGRRFTRHPAWCCIGHDPVNAAARSSYEVHVPAERPAAAPFTSTMGLGVTDYVQGTTTAVAPLHVELRLWSGLPRVPEDRSPHVDVSHLCSTRFHVVVDQHGVASEMARLESKFPVCVIKQNGSSAEEQVPLYVGLDLSDQLPSRREVLLRPDDLDFARVAPGRVHQTKRGDAGRGTARSEGSRQH